MTKKVFCFLLCVATLFALSPTIQSKAAHNHTDDCYAGEKHIHDYTYAFCGTWTTTKTPCPACTGGGKQLTGCNGIYDEENIVYDYDFPCMDCGASITLSQIWITCNICGDGKQTDAYGGSCSNCGAPEWVSGQVGVGAYLGGPCKATSRCYLCENKERLNFSYNSVQKNYSVVKQKVNTTTYYLSSLCPYTENDYTNSAGELVFPVCDKIVTNIKVYNE